MSFQDDRKERGSFGAENAASPNGSRDHRAPSAWRARAGGAIAVVAAVAAITGAVAWIVRLPDAGPIEIVIPTPSPIFVQVDGAVASPGVYSLAPGARLNDAVVAAGGLIESADAGSLNLAARAIDGQRLLIPAAGVASVASAPRDAPRIEAPQSPAFATRVSSLLDLNTASVQQLEELPGIGVKRAELIVGFRLNRGPISRVDDLLAISGIGPVTVNSIRPLVVQP